MKERLTLIIDRQDKTNPKQATAAIRDVVKALRPLATKYKLRLRVAKAPSSVGM